MTATRGRVFKGQALASSVNQGHPVVSLAARGCAARTVSVVTDLGRWHLSRIRSCRPNMWVDSRLELANQAVGNVGCRFIRVHDGVGTWQSVIGMINSVNGK